MSKTVRDLGEEYATRIKQAVAQYESYLTKSLTKRASDLAYSNLGREIIAIGEDIDSLTFDDDTSLTEEDKQCIADATANALGWHRPRTLRLLTKGGSVDALLTMSQQLEELFRAVKKERERK